MMYLSLFLGRRPSYWKGSPVQYWSFPSFIGKLLGDSMLINLKIVLVYMNSTILYF